MTDVHQEFACGLVRVADKVGVAEAGDEFRALSLQSEFSKLFQVLQFSEEVAFEKAFVEDFGAASVSFELDVLDAGTGNKPRRILADEQYSGVGGTVVRQVEKTQGSQLDFDCAFVFLDFSGIDNSRKNGASEEVEIQVFDGGIQARFGFEVWSVEFPALHEDALFFLVGEGTDGMAELFRGIGGDGALGAFILGILQEWKYGFSLSISVLFLMRS